MIVLTKFTAATGTDKDGSCLVHHSSRLRKGSSLYSKISRNVEDCGFWILVPESVITPLDLVAKHPGYKKIYRKCTRRLSLGASSELQGFSELAATAVSVRSTMLVDTDHRFCVAILTMGLKM